MVTQKNTGYAVPGSLSVIYKDLRDIWSVIFQGNTASFPEIEATGAETEDRYFKLMERIEKLEDR